MAFAFYCFTKACEIIWSKACNEMLVLCTVKLMFNHLFCEKNLYIPTNVGYNLSFVKKKKSVHFLQTLLHLSGIRENGVRCVTLKKCFVF